MTFSMPEGFASYFREWEERIGAFIEFAPDGVEGGADSGTALPGAVGGAELPGAAAGVNLKDLPFAVKDNIAVQGFSLSCASKLLEKFRSPYTATAVRK
ncbi:MAG: Asp-tRNA(Asn)/Glu-tRNA(Gln) amidotransferase subunit GatA, partial [Treponema sp.]|nr:Asp-tRNA(Asn)/Glu-tRNA(Gln) amidotransferase subunit GatA [Treponema sp.]